VGSSHGCRAAPDARRLHDHGTLTTDAGPLDLLVGLQDRHGVVHDYDALRPGAVEVPAPGGGVMWAAALEAIIDSQEVAGRPKDHEALPELRAILERQG
jgi:hypothetical protein